MPRCCIGDDANDLPLREMQEDLNMSLAQLLQKQAQQPPTFNFKQEHKQLRCSTETIEEVFANIPKKATGTTSFDDTNEPPDSEKSSGNGAVLQAAIAHYARPKELAAGRPNSSQIKPPATPEVWFHMGPRDDNSNWRQDVESSWKTTSVVVAAPLHNTLPFGDAPTVSPPIASPFPYLPVQLRPPPGWEPIPPSAISSPADTMRGPLTSEELRPAYKVPGISTSTHDPAGRELGGVDQRARHASRSPSDHPGCSWSSCCRDSDTCTVSGPDLLTCPPTC